MFKLKGDLVHISVYMYYGASQKQGDFRIPSNLQHDTTEVHVTYMLRPCAD